ncbi:MAG TPA: hypothetical protein VKM35_12005 [Arenimonas sp.]|uniref:hypothetical protein n=1 Tax=Arenimonas sp. TaxID=1872635 RepID=UPI002BB304A5|nr:hypothetical protein [Arenimonas sp.]HMB57914.1 hypothetical protein [Arenimonas sp.]
MPFVVRALLLSASLLLPTFVACADDSKALKPQIMIVKVSAQGEVTDLDYRTETPTAIRDLLAASVRSWKFSPQQIDGKPVPWATELTVWLVAHPDAGGFRLTVDRAETGNISVARGGYPEMPVGLSRSFRQAQACVDLSLGPDGKTNTIEALWVDDRPVGEDDPIMRSLRKSLSGWQLKPLIVDGTTYSGGAVRAAVVFSATNADMRSLIFSLKCQIKPLTQVGAFRLLTPVSGTALENPSAVTGK